MLAEASTDNFLSCVTKNPFVIFLLIAPGNPPCESAVVEAEKFDQAAAGVALFVVNLDESPFLAAKFDITKIPCYLGWRNSVLAERYCGVTTLEELNKLATTLQVGRSEIN